LRRAVSRERLEGARLPQLRKWTARVFVAYIAVTLPAVGVFVLFLLSRLPQLVGLVWDAIRLQAAQLMTAAASSEATIVMLAVLQIGMLALELVATAFILTKLGAQTAKGIAALGRHGGRGRAAAWGLVVVLGAGLTFLWGPHIAGLSAVASDGVQYYEVTSRNHVEGHVDYPQNPPVGGDHAVAYQTCGFYRGVVPREQAVHSMEHGAVWITYRPDVTGEEIDELRSLATGRSYVLVTAFPTNPAPVVASAWGRQLRVDRADDPRLEHFIRAFRLGTNAPERGGPCDHGAGTPDAN
jgi:hypothetical protein